MLNTDEEGVVLFADLAPGSYTVTPLATNGIVYDGAPTVVEYVDGVEQITFSVTVDLGCEPASAGVGLVNMGFEAGMDGWTQGYQTEGIAVTGADDFTAPWEGQHMARLGRSQPSDEVSQPEGPNILCQDFVVDSPMESFAFNIFTYDYTGFDSFDFDVVVSDPASGQTLAAYEQGAFGSGTALKTSGWRGVELDLADHVGDTVRLTLRAGGTRDSLYAFWAYLDSADVLPPTIETPVANVETESGSVTTDPVTGQITVSMPSGDPSALTMTIPADCANPETEPSEVRLLLDGKSFDGVAGATGYVVTIPESEIASGFLTAEVVCPGETTVATASPGSCWYDPSGIVTDATSGEPVVGATVHLHHVPGWTPQTGSGPYPANSCQTNETKPAGTAWNQPAPTGLGELVNAASPMISPNVNPFVTNNVGYYGWDVAEGCWYVTVTALGYEPLGRARDRHHRAPLVRGRRRPDAPPIVGSSRVGEILEATPGTWDVEELSYAYQWLRDGQDIDDATNPTYTVSKSDVGKPISVRVVATRAGFVPGTATSSPRTGLESAACTTARSRLATARAAVVKATGKARAATLKVNSLTKKLKAAVASGNAALVTRLKKQLKAAKAALTVARQRRSRAVASQTRAAQAVRSIC